MPLRTEHIEVGTRVSYEDAANPRREGTVTEILDDGREFRVHFPADPSKFGDEYGLEERETVSDLRQHGWYILADLPGSIFDGAEIISSYTTLDAISDGQLIPVADLVSDEPNFCREAGWKVPVVLTPAVASLAIPTEREAYDYGQDVKGRLWDLLSMARLYAARKPDSGVALFPCIFQLAGPDRERWTKRAAQKTLHFKAVIGDDGSGEPVATILLRDED